MKKITKDIPILTLEDLDKMLEEVRKLEITRKKYPMSGNWHKPQSRWE